MYITNILMDDVSFPKLKRTTKNIDKKLYKLALTFNTFY